MDNGREVSKENIWNLKQNLVRLYSKQVRISDQIRELTTIINEHEPSNNDKCWSCSSTNKHTTALTLCEVGNPLYPLACDEFACKGGCDDVL